MNRRDLLKSAAGAVIGLSSDQAFGQSRAALLTRWLQRWLAAFNDPDLRVYRRFVETFAPSVLPYVDEDLGVREISGGFELVGVQVTGPDEITAWMKDRRWDRHSRLVLTATDAEQLGDISFASAPISPAIRRLDEGQALAMLAAKLAAESRAGRFSGAVIVARDGEVRFRRAAGIADIEGSRANRISTRFCIGSMGKMFTAVAIMQLVESGRLALSDRVGSHLTDYPNRAIADRVTIEQLLTHSGGTGDIFGPDYDANAARLRTTADFIAFYGTRAPDFEPGSRWGYSNYGYVLLGAILERVTGRPYANLVEERVFRRCAMAATSMSFERPYPGAIPYTGAAQTGIRPLAPYAGLPAGGGYSTVEDLHAFILGLGRGRLVSTQTLETMRTPRIRAGAGQWGLGFAIRMRNGVSYYGHGGGAPGINADLAIFPGYQTIVLCNRGHPAAVNVADFIGARLPLASANEVNDQTASLATPAPAR